MLGRRQLRVHRDFDAGNHRRAGPTPTFHHGAVGRLRASRRDAVGRYEKGPGGNGIARRAMILAQLALGPLPEAVPVGINNEGISIRDAGPKRAPERAGKQPVQVGMEESARRQPVAGCDDDQASPVPLPCPFQLGRPAELAQIRDGHFVNGLSIRLPSVRVMRWSRTGKCLCSVGRNRSRHRRAIHSRANTGWRSRN